MEFVNRDTNDVFAHAQLISVEEKRLGEITPTDTQGHESFLSQKEMYTRYADYYHCPVNPGTRVKIVRFRLHQ